MNMWHVLRHRITRVRNTRRPLSSVLAGAVGFGEGRSPAQAAEGLARVTPCQGAPWGSSAPPHRTFPPSVLHVLLSLISALDRAWSFSFLCPHHCLRCLCRVHSFWEEVPPCGSDRLVSSVPGQHRQCQPRLLPEQGPLCQEGRQSLLWEPTQGHSPPAPGWGLLAGVPSSGTGGILHVALHLEMAEWGLGSCSFPTREFCYQPLTVLFLFFFVN